MNEREIFVQAIDLAPAARLRFVVEACAGNADLQARVEKLLESHEQVESVLDRPPLAIGESPTNDDDSTTTFAFLAPPSRPDSIGRVAHYEVLRCIGEGAFGMVFLAFDEHLQREVAIKMLKPELAASPLAKERFLREARSAAAIRHENAVQVHAVESTPLPYLVMEYIDGPTLGDRLQSQGRIPFDELLTLGAQIARGLAAAHARGLVHRDIKPGNVLLERDRPLHVKITDFGLARAADDAGLSHSHLIAGTPRYMAPEQALGETIDARSDLFSLGSVLYEMASGRQAFPAPTLYAVLKSVAEAAPRPLCEIAPELPLAFCALVEQLHAKSPTDRPASAAEVAERLEALRRSEPHIASPLILETKATTGRHIRLPIAAGATLAVAIAALLAVIAASGRNLPVTDDTHSGTIAKPPDETRTPTTPPDDAPTPANANSTNSGPETTPPASKDSLTPDQSGVSFILLVGGKATIADGDDVRELSGNDTAPTTDFRLLKIDLEDVTGISNRGLESFRGCRHVTELVVHSKNVGDEGIASFAACKELRKLDLAGTGVTDVGLAAFRDCVGLEELDLSHTQVGDEGMAVFATCESLHTVRLADTNVTDDGLRHLAGASNLRKLDLSETPIAGKTIVPLFGERKQLELWLSREKMAPPTSAEITRRFVMRAKFDKPKFDKPKRPPLGVKPGLNN